MDDATIKKAVQLVSGRCKLEVSGSITLERLESLKHLGIDFISVGALTHSARAMDISMRLDMD
jgi:nicotinate-nucleotide pyrophosphorylase (carboxylating)